jgi:SOS-response transcriptional repressor LexA
MPTHLPFSRIMQDQLPKAYTLAMPDDGLDELGIVSGDALLVVPQHTYKNGDIVALRIGRRVYVRRYYATVDYFFLEAANGRYTRLSVARNSPGIQVLGCVTRVLPASA